MLRISKISVNNLAACDSIRIEPSDSGGYLVRLALSDRVSYLTSGDGSLQVYASPLLAMKACKRHSQVKPTTI